MCIRDSRDVEHVYRQDSDFQYLTGLPEPEAVMALITGREHGEYVLFCRERDPERELWDGLRAGQDGAIANYGADDAFPIGDIDDILPGLIEEMCIRDRHARWRRRNGCCRYRSRPTRASRHKGRRAVRRYLARRRGARECAGWPWTAH